MALPTLLLTRPRESAEAFAATLDPAARAAVHILIAPLMDIAGTDVAVALEAGEGAIFTSANGVRFAPDGGGRRAFCVGSQTTTRAQARGWQAVQAGDTAEQLVKTLRAQPPGLPLWHLGGEHTIGDIAEKLSADGIPTYHLTLYHQRLLSLPSAALLALGAPCILPVFSQRTAQSLVDQAGNQLSHAHVIALSESVAVPFDGKTTAKCLILPAPQAIYMRKAVENLCLTLSLP
jgi:uroporphyrinogen-III synthase